MENSTTWLLIADASKARIFSLVKARIFNDPNNDKNLQLIGTYVHEESRKKGAELISDKMGEFGSGTFVEATSPKVHEAEHFAHELVNHLEIGRNNKSFRDLILISPPAFMGLLHKFMSHEIHKLVTKTIEKDYTQLNTKELLQSLLNYL